MWVWKALRRTVISVSSPTSGQTERAGQTLLFAKRERSGLETESRPAPPVSSRGPQCADRRLPALPPPTPPCSERRPRCQGPRTRPPGPPYLHDPRRGNLLRHRTAQPASAHFQISPGNAHWPFPARPRALIGPLAADRWWAEPKLRSRLFICRLPSPPLMLTGWADQFPPSYWPAAWGKAGLSPGVPPGAGAPLWDGGGDYLAAAGVA